MQKVPALLSSSFLRSNESTEHYEGARRKVAAFINAPRPEEVVFTRNATEGGCALHGREMSGWFEGSVGGQEGGYGEPAVGMQAWGRAGGRHTGMLRGHSR